MIVKKVLFLLKLATNFLNEIHNFVLLSFLSLASPLSITFKKHTLTHPGKKPLKCNIKDYNFMEEILDQDN